MTIRTLWLFLFLVFGVVAMDACGNIHRSKEATSQEKPWQDISVQTESSTPQEPSPKELSSEKYPNDRIVEGLPKELNPIDDGASSVEHSENVSDDIVGDRTHRDSQIKESTGKDNKPTERTPPPPDRPAPPDKVTPPPDRSIPPDKPPAPLAYPKKSLYHIKGLQPDFWPQRADVIGNNVGRIAVNLVWAHWEPVEKKPPCASNEVTFDQHCFRIQQHLEKEIKAYSAKGIVVTGVLYGVPAWARKGRVCSPVSAGFDIFCAPNKASDYARFTGMIARRYNGLQGVGRVADFVIHNEVNANDWFDIGCGQGVTCNTKQWLDTYSANYNAAYDAITAEQPHAKVLVSLDHHFGTQFDQPSKKNPLLSGITVLRGVAARAGNRKWRVAFHSYPPDLRRPDFSIDDFPRVTFGNLGVLAGWLRQSYPNTPSAWDIQLTENGINSLSPSTPQRQASALCDAFRNILGTPGISSFIYHRMKDHPVEVNAGFGAGLFSAQGVAKPAWSVWALANRNDITPPRLSCGFEVLPYVRLTRYYLSSRGHWASTRLPPKGFKAESSWRLLREPAPGTKLLYSCRVGQHNMISPALNCENQSMLGPVGYIYTSPKSPRVPLYRCRVGAGSDHFLSSDSGCEKQNKDMLLGYALP